MKGFTLVEVLVTVLILSILIIGLYGVLNVGNMSATQDMGLLDLQQQARLAMNGMILELRQSRASDISIPSPSYSTLPSVQFAVPASLNPVTYSNPIIYYLNNNQISRVICTDSSCTAVSAPRVLANHISNLIFSPSGNILQIQLRVANRVGGRNLCFPGSCSQTLFYTERVRLRNE